MYPKVEYLIFHALLQNISKFPRGRPEALPKFQFLYIPPKLRIYRIFQKESVNL